ncbi:MAG: hypothetical protein K2M91_10750, partial [Lachnospiraceae bacterium]|nr:hypothetical protein [Lachnospiraceae bacterium]
LLDWANEEYERMERIDCDRGWKDFRVALTDEEKSFVTVTVWLSGMENGAYVRSLTKKEPEQDIEVNINLPSKDVTAQNGNANAWCSLYYSFSYHILDKEKATIGERDERIGKVIGDIENYWETSDVEELLKMTEDDMIETLHQIAAKYSSDDITITIMDKRTSFESMDERRIEFS